MDPIALTKFHLKPTHFKVHFAFGLVMLVIFIFHHFGGVWMRKQIIDKKGSPKFHKFRRIHQVKIFFFL